MATTGPLQVDVTVHLLSFELCEHGNKHGECVLANGHETYETANIGDRPETCHIDRNGKRWGVSGTPS